MNHKSGRTSAISVAMLLCLSPVCLPPAAGQTKTAEAEKSSITHADARQAARLVAGKKVTVLDVRTPKEFAAGRIPGAVNIDFNARDFARKLDALDKSKTYLVHCAVGGRSTKSLEQFKKLGFKSVVHLDGGFKSWQKAGQPVEKPVK